MHLIQGSCRSLYSYSDPVEDLVVQCWQAMEAEGRDRDTISPGDFDVISPPRKGVTWGRIQVPLRDVVLARGDDETVRVRLLVSHGKRLAAGLLVPHLLLSVHRGFVGAARRSRGRLRLAYDTTPPRLARDMIRVLWRAYLSIFRNRSVRIHSYNGITSYSPSRPSLRLDLDGESSGRLYSPPSAFGVYGIERIAALWSSFIHLGYNVFSMPIDSEYHVVYGFAPLGSLAEEAGRLLEGRSVFREEDLYLFNTLFGGPTSLGVAPVLYYIATSLGGAYGHAWQLGYRFYAPSALRDSIWAPYYNGIEEYLVQEEHEHIAESKSRTFTGYPFTTIFADIVDFGFNVFLANPWHKAIARSFMLTGFFQSRDFFDPRHGEIVMASRAAMKVHGLIADARDKGILTIPLLNSDDLKRLGEDSISTARAVYYGFRVPSDILTDIEASADQLAYYWVSGHLTPEVGSFYRAALNVAEKIMNVTTSYTGIFQELAWPVWQQSDDRGEPIPINFHTLGGKAHTICLKRGIYGWHFAEHGGDGCGSSAYVELRVRLVGIGFEVLTPLIDLFRNPVEMVRPVSVSRRTYTSMLRSVSDNVSDSDIIWVYPYIAVAIEAKPGQNTVLASIPFRLLASALVYKIDIINRINEILEEAFTASHVERVA